MFVFMQSKYRCDVKGNIHAIYRHMCINMYVLLHVLSQYAARAGFALSNKCTISYWTVGFVPMLYAPTRFHWLNCYVTWPGCGYIYIRISRRLSAAKSRDLVVAIYKSPFVRLNVILSSASDRRGPQHCYSIHTLNLCSALSRYAERTGISDLIIGV